MPIFEFECQKCRKEFEILFRSGDKDSDVVCPACRSKKVRRMMSAFAGGKSGCGSCAATSCGTT